MYNLNRSISFIFAFLALTLFLISFTTSATAQTLYSCQSSFDGTFPFLHTINPNSGATLSTTEITLAGETFRGCNGMAKDPQTGVCYIMANVGTPGVPSARILATIDVDTGVATAVGNAEQTFATIAFTDDSTLYGVTGNGGGTPETLFRIDPSNGQTTLIAPLGNGDDGEAIAFNTLDGLMYHGSGDGDPYNEPGGQIFEAISINPGLIQIFPRTLQGPAVSDFSFEEQSSMVYRSNDVFLSGTIDELFFSITADGFVTQLGDMDHVSKGLAFDCGFPDNLGVPTMSEWGLITTVIALGLVSFFVLRRRSAFQK